VTVTDADDDRDRGAMVYELPHNVNIDDDEYVHTSKKSSSKKIPSASKK
jgi:hypothetical protein